MWHKEDADRSGTPVSTPAELIAFRAELHNCLSGWADALFELSDALLCAPGPVGSVPSLSLEPVFRRGHGSLYKALALGSIDTNWLRQALVAYRPAGWPLVFAVDTSTWDRCDAETSPERGFYYSASKHSAGQPIVAGWSYQWICQLNWDPDSWTAPLDATRIPPDADSTSATIDQVRRLVDLLPGQGEVPLFVFDAGYDPIALTHGLGAVRAQLLVRIRSDRVFYAQPTTPAPPAPADHGATAAASDCPTPAASLDPTPSFALKTPATAPCASGPGGTCTPSWPGADAGPTKTGHPSSPAPSSESTSSIFRNPLGPSKPCGCGGRGPANRTSTCAGGPTCAVSTSSTPTGSPRTPSDGPPRRCEHPNRPTAGHGLSSAPTPNCVWPEASWRTGDCPGNDGVIPPNSPPPASAGDFIDFAPPSAHQPVHRNPTHPAPDGQKAPADRPEPAIRRSKKQPNHRSAFNRKLRHRGRYSPRTPLPGR